MPHGQSAQKVDTHQLKHLLLVAVKLDMRSCNQQFGTGKARRFPPIVQLMLFQFLVSIGFAIALQFMSARLFSTMLVVGAAMTFTALNVMIEFGNLIMSPEDHDIISPLPVNSRTFFYAKLINLLLYTTALTMALGLAPTVSILIKTHNPLHALLFPALLLTANATVSLGVASVYASLLKYVSRERLTSVLGYVQMLMGGLVYGGYVILPRIMSRGALQFEDVTDWWIFLLPPAWFASFIGFAGEIDSSHWIWSLMIGLVVLTSLYLYCSKYLSISYSASIARGSASGRAKDPLGAYRKPAGRGIFARLLNPEEIAIFKLIWAQFKYDSRFKMTILAVVPMTVLYFFLSVTDEGGIADPFVSGLHGAGSHLFLVFLAVGIFPSMIQGGVLHSASYKASWVFFSTPSDLSKIMLSTRRFIQLFFLIPYLAALCIALGYFLESYLHALFLLVVLYQLTMIQLAVTYMLFPGVPFSRPLKHAQTGSTFIFSMFMPIVTILLPMAILQAFVFTNSTAYAVAVVVLIVLERLITALSRRTVAQKAAALQRPPGRDS